MSHALSIQAEAISDEIEKLGAPIIGLGLLLGGDHPVTVKFTELVRLAIECSRLVPETFPVSPEEREKFTASWEHLAARQREFLALAHQLVGVRISGVAGSADTEGAYQALDGKKCVTDDLPPRPRDD